MHLGIWVTPATQRRYRAKALETALLTAAGKGREKNNKPIVSYLKHTSFLGVL